MVVIVVVVVAMVVVVAVLWSCVVTPGVRVAVVAVLGVQVQCPREGHWWVGGGGTAQLL